jgi:hypothetical protein
MNKKSQKMAKKACMAFDWVKPLNTPIPLFSRKSEQKPVGRALRASAALRAPDLAAARGFPLRARRLQPAPVPQALRGPLTVARVADGGRGGGAVQGRLHRFL